MGEIQDDHLLRCALQNEDYWEARYKQMKKIAYVAVAGATLCGYVTGRVMDDYFDNKKEIIKKEWSTIFNDHRLVP